MIERERQVREGERLGRGEEAMRGWRRLGWSREIRRRDGSRGYTGECGESLRSRDKEPDDGESRNK